MKTIILILTSLLMANTVQAQLAAASTINPQEKVDEGFSIKYLSEESLDGFIAPTFAVETKFGRSQGAFSIILRAIVISDLDGVPQMKLASHKVALSKTLSNRVYDILAVDFTAKKIAEGVEMDRATVQCQSSDRCLMIDEVGDNFLFSNNTNPFKGHSDFDQAFVNSRFEPLAFSGKILSGSNQMTKDFLQAVIRESFTRAPNLLVYENKVTTTPTDNKSYTQHRVEADNKQASAMGEHPLEKLIVESLINNPQSTYKERVRKPSGGSCTYFCPASGRFVESLLSADVNF